MKVVGATAYETEKEYLQTVFRAEKIPDDLVFLVMFASTVNILLKRGENWTSVKEKTAKHGALCSKHPNTTLSIIKYQVSAV